MIVDTINLPFLGTREDDHVSFQYLLQAVEGPQVQFLIPRWVANREVLQPDHRVAFHMTLDRAGQYFDKGRVIEVRWEDHLGGQLCIVHLEPSSTGPAPVTLACHETCLFVETEAHSRPAEKLQETLQETILLKKGVAIYLDRLIPYYARVSGYPVQDYPLLRQSFLEDITHKARSNQARIEGILARVRREVLAPGDIPKVMDLEELRDAVESELSLDLFRITFDNEPTTDYILAIKDLERRLYTQYNTVVLLYIQAL